MFKTSNDLKQFILWAKNQGVQEVHVGKVVVIFSPYALAEAQINPEPTPGSFTPNEHKNTSKSLVDTEDPVQSAKEDDDLLFYSAQ